MEEQEVYIYLIYLLFSFFFLNFEGSIQNEENEMRTRIDHFINLHKLNNSCCCESLSFVSCEMWTKCEIIVIVKHLLLLQKKNHELRFCIFNHIHDEEMLFFYLS